jgi:methyltransferase family protein
MMLLRIAADVFYWRGASLLQGGHPRRALAHLALAARLSSQPNYLHAAAMAASAAGERDRAARYCERALTLDPGLAAADALLFEMFLQGEDYFQVLRRIHGHLRPRTYIEIGVEEGNSLRYVLPGTVTLGVDPDPAVAFPLPPNMRVFAETSDDFFARHDVGAELNGLPVDLALIDGMHHFEFALRDFMNLERLSTAESTILVHDCFPHDRRTAQRERLQSFWSGDIWRLIVLLKKYRPDLSIHTIATPPTGLGVVRNLDPSSRFIADNLGRLCAEFMALDYSYLEKDRATKLNLFPNDWEQIRPLLARQL